MSQTEYQSATREQATEAVNRCAQAYLRIRSTLPKTAGQTADQENRNMAADAYLAELPLLIDPPSFQLYIACISQGTGIGAIDPVDVGRFCHIASTAMQAWKLANLAVPAAQKKEEREQKKAEEDERRREEKTTPLPSKGNHRDGDVSNIEVEMALQNALSHLPRFDAQKQYFQLLRNHGQLLPCDAELRDNPLAALHFCRLAESVIREETLANNPPPAPKGPEQDPQPAPASQEHQAEAA